MLPVTVSQSRLIEPQRIDDDTDRGKRHCCRRYDWRQQNSKHGVEDAGCDGNACRVVKEGEKQVLADIGHRRRREMARSHNSVQIPLEQRYAGAFHGNIGAGPHCNADVSGRQRRRIVDTIARHRDDASFGAISGDDFTLVLGQHFGFDL